MKDKKGKASRKPGTTADSEMSLQKELARESAEGRDSIGDIGSNRTLTGSSTWETLPDKNRGSAPSKGKAKPSKRRKG
jgi:hypothetical protein